MIYKSFWTVCSDCLKLENIGEPQIKQLNNELSF